MTTPEITTIDKILVANRGEIALRVMRTCRRMGIATVAVFSDADAGAPHVACADEAVRLGAAAAAESYLNIGRILDAAEETGADAIHPGYGFLAENADFAEACARRGVTFIGPSAEVIRVLGSKKESKRIAGDAGVPVIPGSTGDDQAADALAAEAERIGYPVLLKASAGGGGKGMQVVRAAADLPGAIDSAKRISKSAFGDDTLLVEKYIERPRHVEIQILGDTHGDVVHLFERECSIQRRHQKIIEESPSPALDAELRAEMGAAAVALARAVGYTNAGTVEFILGPDRAFYFLEVNTRLQVEHPVTEGITGIDLVREQIRVARGERLGFAQDDVAIDGAAIECRLYAEDADRDFTPAAGTIADWHLPSALLDTGDLRVDAGVETGSEVPIHYDPMLAKVICHAPTRAEAIDKMRYALRAMSVQGITTNRALLVRVLGHAAFRAGDTDTHFLDTHAAELRAGPRDPELVTRAAIAATLAAHEVRRAGRRVLPHLEPGWRNNRFAPERCVYILGGDELEVAYANHGGGRFLFAFGDDARHIRLVGVAGPEVVFDDADSGRRHRVRVVRAGADWYVHGFEGDVVLTEVPRFADAEGAAVAGGCVAPMPGKVTRVLVSEGQAVSAGDALVILEAMKMEHTVTGPEDGVITHLAVSEGDQVDTDQLLVVVGHRDDADDDSTE